MTQHNIISYNIVLSYNIRTYIDSSTVNSIQILFSSTQKPLGLRARPWRVWQGAVVCDVPHFVPEMGLKSEAQDTGNKERESGASAQMIYLPWTTNWQSIFQCLRLQWWSPSSSVDKEHIAAPCSTILSLRNRLDWFHSFLTLWLRRWICQWQSAGETCWKDSNTYKKTNIGQPQQEVCLQSKVAATRLWPHA